MQFYALIALNGAARKIFSHINTESEDETGVNVLIDSFSGRTIRIRVAKKKGKEKENLLNEEKLDEESEDYHSVWSSLSAKYVFN